MVENAEMCQRHRGARLLYQNEQGTEYSSGYQDEWASPYKYPHAICNPGICNSAEIWGLGKWSIGLVPFNS